MTNTNTQITYQIVREGFYFRAVGSDGSRSPLVTSASQAGLYIARALARRTVKRGGEG